MSSSSEAFIRKPGVENGKISLSPALPIHGLLEFIRDVTPEILLPEPQIFGLTNFNVLRTPSGELSNSGAILGYAPHNGHIDTIVARMALPLDVKKRMIMLFKAGHWNSKQMRTINALRPLFANSFPLDTEVEGKDKALAQEHDLLSLIEHGAYVGIAPEGTRETQNRHKPVSKRAFEPGAGRLLALSPVGTAYIPIFLAGLEDWWFKGQVLPNFKAIYNSPPTVIFGPPIIKTEDVTDQGTRAINHQRKAFSALIKLETEQLERDYLEGKYR